MRTAATVVVVGCGAAGVTAAIGLARRGIKTIVVEGAAYAGAENWSGAVYFCETLARPEILGPELLKQCAFERRVVKRGILVSDGVVAFGGAVRSTAAFEHAYTVLRPVFDRDLAEKARMLGAEILPNTTALGLIRDGDHVRGVMTSRGPIYADLVFLAEGDASHIVSREGLERKSPGKNGVVAPEFLQGVKEVLALPAAEIERRFGVGAGEGACFEILLRNGSLDGKTVPLNAGAFLYTNRESLSVGFVAPLNNLAQFGGDHNTLMEWLKGLPALRGLLDGAKSISFGAKLIRGGGYREMPTLCLDGLVVGGAAAGLGVDFPCPNYTGPATHCGYLVSEATHAILTSGRNFDRATLESLYLAPLKESVGFKDTEHLADWPHAISSAREFFGRQCDLVAGAASVIIDTESGVVGRHIHCSRHLVETLPVGSLVSFGREMTKVSSALRTSVGMASAMLRALPFWVVNTLRPFLPAGSSTGSMFEPILLADQSKPHLPAPLSCRYLAWRHGNAVADAMHHLYANDGRTLSVKLVAARASILRTLSLWEIVLFPFVMLLNVVLGYVHKAGFFVWVAATKPKLDAILGTFYFKKREERRRANDWRRVKDAIPHDDKLAGITYRGDHASHIGFHVRPDKVGLPETGSVVFSVCPARVYREERDQSLARSVAVLHENCIRCETCWRADSDHVDWGRTRGQRLVFEAYTPASEWTSESIDAASLASLDRRGRLTWTLDAPTISPILIADHTLRCRLEGLIARVQATCVGFRPLHSGVLPILLGADQDYLTKVAADALTALDLVVKETRAGLRAGAEGSTSQLSAIEARLAAIASFVELVRPRVATRRFFDLESDFEILSTHHLPDLIARLSVRPQSSSEEFYAQLDESARPAIRKSVEAAFTKEIVAESEHLGAPTEATRAAIVAQVRAARAGNRDMILEEIARIAPGLAFVASGQMIVAELLADGNAKGDSTTLGELIRASASASVPMAILSGVASVDDSGAVVGLLEATLTCGARHYAVQLGEDSFALVDAAGDDVHTEATGALGLLSARPARVVFDGARPLARLVAPGLGRRVADRVASDACAIARGMASYMSDRAMDHAMNRVQFPGLFRDVRGRDGLAKFGAVQAMLAGISSSRDVLNVLYRRGETGLPAWGLVSELLASSPRSIAYLAGQVLGGTAYSEEDPVCRFYRDASAMTRLPVDTEQLAAGAAERFVQDTAPHGSLPVPSDPDWLAAELASTAAISRELGSCVSKLSNDDLAATGPQIGRLSFHLAAVTAQIEVLRADAARGDIRPLALGSLQWMVRRLESRVRKFVLRSTEIGDMVALGQAFLARNAEEGPSCAKGATYADYLATKSTFKSGDSVLAPGEARSLIYSPELLDADPELQALEVSSVSEFKARFRTHLIDGRSYPRHVEHLHHVPLEDIAWLVDTGRFRMTIPKDEGGLGMDKASYYIVCRAMMRFGDPAQSLIVMGSTSIGTTPFLIGLEQDLPTATKAFAKAEGLTPIIADLTTQITRVVAMLGGPDAIKVKTPFEALMSASKKAFGSDKALRPIFGKCQDALLNAGKAGLKKDAPGMLKALGAALDGLMGWENRLAAEKSSLPHREAMLRFWLRQIAAGRISAFALTEPSAGSDTARIRTRAERVEVPCTRDPRGFYVFTPAGGRESRNLFTTDAFVFDGGALWFVRPDGKRAIVVQRDFTFDPKPGESMKHRYVELDGTRVAIHDLGAVREENGVAMYPYWRVNGAKMWITNGTVAGVMALYARTPKGPSAFVLDAHAEGLAIGKDEHKMGQRGSSTNELALTDVRIPVDALVGIEGRGQENALETLNVGRAGLAFTVSGVLHDVVNDVREALAKSSRDLRKSDLYEFGKIALDVIGAESVAFQLVGRFDHEGTDSIRMESAIGKAESGEAFHRVIRRAERICGRRGVLADIDLEKRRRDARVITIYEGTNEIQRFLLSKDLIDSLDLAGFAGEVAPTGDASLDLIWDGFAKGRAALGAKTGELRGKLASRAWQEVHLQPLVFPLVESFMQLSVAGAVARRLGVAQRLCGGDGAVSRLTLLEGVAKRLSISASQLSATRLADYEAEYARVKLGHGPLAQWIADRALIAHAPLAENLAAPIVPKFTGPRRVLVVVDPRPAVAPRPRVRDGRLGELLLELAPDDRAVLAQALAQRKFGEVEIVVVGVGGPSALQVLDEALALGADDAVLIDTGNRALLAVDIAACVTEWIATAEDFQGPFAAILGSESAAGLLVPLARRLNAPTLRSVDSIGLAGSLELPVLRVRLGSPATVVDAPSRSVLLMSGELSPELLSMTVMGWATAQTKSISVIDFTPREASAGRLDIAAVSANLASNAQDGALTTVAAAARFGALAGLHGGGASASGESMSIGEIHFRDVSLKQATHFALVLADADGSISSAGISAASAAARLATLAEGTAVAWVLLPGASIESCTAALTSLHIPGLSVMVLQVPTIRGTPDSAVAAWLELAVADFEGAFIVAPELRGVGLTLGELFAMRNDTPMFDGMDRVAMRAEGVVVSGARHDGKTRFSVVAPSNHTMSVLARAEIQVESLPESSGTSRLFVVQDVPPIEGDELAQALREAQGELGVVTLADAEFVIDVGYGVGSRDGLELVVEPLKAALERMGVRKVMVGASRKVTLDLGILPDELQIGQTGVAVNPKVILALGISGAPQHMNYIGERAVIFAFNRDPDAPIFMFNKSRPRPLVLAVPGDLFVEVPKFIKALESAVAMPV